MNATVLEFILKCVWYSNTFSCVSNVSFLASNGTLSFSHLSQNLLLWSYCPNKWLLRLWDLSCEILILRQQVLLPAEPSHLCSLPVCFAFEMSSWLAWDPLCSPGCFHSCSSSPALVSLVLTLQACTTILSCNLVLSQNQLVDVWRAARRAKWLETETSWENIAYYHTILISLFFPLAASYICAVNFGHSRMPILLSSHPPLPFKLFFPTVSTPLCPCLFVCVWLTELIRGVTSQICKAVELV